MSGNSSVRNKPEADGWGLGDDLRKRLGDSRLLARGPKARGAIRAAGLTEAWSPASESMSEVLDRLVEQIVAGDLDAVTFTSAPAVLSLFQCAEQSGVVTKLVEALRHRVLPVCVGPVTAAPLERRGVATVQPDRPRLGNLVRVVVDQLPARRGRPLSVHGHVVDVRSHAVVVDGLVVTLPPAPMAVLAALAAQPGRVLTRQELLAALPGGGTDEHAVEMAVTRLRAALGDAAIVQTIVKRGYRLAYDP